MTKRKENPTPPPSSQHLTDKKLVEEILLAVPLERIEKLKLLKDQTCGSYHVLIQKRIAQLERQQECVPLRDKVLEINERLARRGREVSHG